MIRRFCCVGVLAFGLLAMSVPAAHAATTPDTWAPKFCKAFKQWQTTTTSESNKLNAALAKTSGADLLGLRKQFVAFLGNEVAATEAALQSIKKAGPPSSVNGKQIEKKVIASFQSSEDVFDQARRDAAKLSTSDAQSFVTDSATIQTNLGSAADGFQQNFSDISTLDKDGKLQAAFGKAKSCAFLASASGS